MKVLFIGGTGTISTHCTRLAAARGIDLYLLNRGRRDANLAGGGLPNTIKTIRADIRKSDEAAKALDGHTFDVVVNWIAFTPEHVETDLDLFRGKCGQYVFISSASAYQKPVAALPITESTPLANPWWQYSRHKIACEARLMRAYRDNGFPMTVVRPSHTYNETSIPLAFSGGPWTVPDRLRRGQPVVVPGDGTSLWVLTHSRDFAHAFVGLLGHRQSIGHAFHVTSDQVLTWDHIYRTVSRAVGVSDPNLVHLPSDFLAAHAPEKAGGLLGDKSHSVIFDNTKIKRFVPDYLAPTRFDQGVAESVAWYEADPSRQTISDEHNQLQDKMIAAYQKAMP